MKKLVIVGAGAHSKVVLDLAMQCPEYEIAGLIDRDPGTCVLGIPVIGRDEDLQALFDSGIRYGFAAIGNNRIRKKVQEQLEQIGFEVPSFVSPHAVVSRFAQIGPGTLVMPGAIINAEACIGSGCIINTNASVDHDCRIGSFVHIAPGCAISGSTNIGEGSFLGTGSRVIDRISIGKNVTIGAGATVVKDLPDDCLAIGTPARIRDKS